MSKFVDKLQKMWNLPDDEYEDDMDEDEEVDDETEESQGQEEEPARRNFAFARNNDDNKVVNINAKAQLQVVLFKPLTFGEETRSIADELLSRHTVVLNLEKTEKDVSRRIIDFLSGVAYANKGKIKRVATNTFIITPYNVDLTGEDVLDELESSGVYF